MQHVEHLLEHDVVVRYLERTPHLAWTCPEGTKLEYVDVYVDSDWGGEGDGLQEQSLCRDPAGTVCGRNEFNDARRHLSRVAKQSSLRRCPTAASPNRNWLPTSVACTGRSSRRSRHDDEAWIWPGETSRYQSTLVSGSNREGELPTDEGRQREQCSRHWHQVAECRQNRSSPTAAGNGHSMSTAG